jgi:esterase/lipase superfamily enzyme
MGKSTFGRQLLLVGALVLCPLTVHAQAARSGAGQCEVSPGETLSSLEKRKQSIERALARTAAVKTNGAKSDANALEATVRKSKEELLNVLFQIDCLTAAEQRPAKRSAVVVPPVIEVVTYYATNRKQTANVEPAAIYGQQAATALQYGRVVVSIPATHTPGSLELPTLWRLERTADPSKHFVLKSVTPLDGQVVRKEMAEKLQGMGSKALLLFVHGYNSGFAEAALRTAQLAHDLKFPGMALFYSWPSAGRLLGYWQDEETSQLSESVFEQLLEELSELPVSDVYILGHSMGSRIVTAALRSRVDKGKETKHVRELLLAAPDINTELFRRVIAPKLAAISGMRTTVYASSSDLALKASKIVHGFSRVGDTIGDVFIYPGIETVDASGAATVARSYGHSYLMDSSSVLKDVQVIIERKIAAKLRGLKQVGSAPNEYWRMQ